MNRYDYAVVGGGIAGTSAAYFLSERASVVVLEAEPVLGVHSTGRSAAVFTECYGAPVIRRLAMASREFLEHPIDGFADGPILTPRGIVFVATADQAPGLSAAVDAQRALVPSVRGLERDEVVELCGVIDPDVIVGGVFEPEATDLDVHALHTAYQKGIRRRGGEIRTRFPVEAARRTADGWVIRSGESEVAAGVIVDAAGAWCDRVATMCGVAEIGLVPRRRTAFTCAPPEGEDHRSWPMVIDFDERYYFKPDGPNLLASPADTTPMEPHDVRHREEDVAMGIERIQDVTTMTIRSVLSAWAGLRSFVADGLPVNGWDDAVEGFYWLAGQGGVGIKTSPAMGSYAASMMLDGAPSAGHAAAGMDEVSLGVERLR